MVLLVQAYRRKFRDAAAGDMKAPGSVMKGILNDLGRELKKDANGNELNALPQDLTGIIPRKTGWIVPRVGYEPCLCDNDWRDWGIQIGLFTILYIWYAIFMIITLTLYDSAEDTWLWISLGFQICGFTGVGVLVVMGQKAQALEEEAARQEAARLKEQEKAAARGE